MAESSLTLTYTDLMTEVAYYLGYGRAFRDPASATASIAAQGTHCHAIVKRGIRNFYHPPPLATTGEVHCWSFLRATASLSLVAGTYDYDLPDDWDYPVDEPYITSSTFDKPVKIRSMAPGSMDQLRMNTTSTDQGQPVNVAVIEKAKDTSKSTRYAARFWQTPDQSYTLGWRYAVKPNELGASNVYHYGGAAHSETVLMACLAAAELDVQKSAGGYADQFQRCLVGSVQHDKTLIKRDVEFNMGDWMRQGNGPEQGYTLKINGVEI